VSEALGRAQIRGVERAIRSESKELDHGREKGMNGEGTVRRTVVREGRDAESHRPKK